MRHKAYVHYDARQERVVVDSIVADPVSDFVILHEATPAETRNSFTSQDSVDIVLSNKNANPYIQWRTDTASFDKHIIELKADTLKNAVWLSADGGFGKVLSSPADGSYQTDSENGLASSVALGYYRMLSLWGQNADNRLGLELGLGLSIAKSDITVDYSVAYPDVDSDGGPYERKLDSQGFRETLHATTFKVPVALRYDKLLKPKLSLFARLGLDLGVGIKDAVDYKGNVNVAGYYDWLFDITMDEEGIYDFGPHSLSGNADVTNVGTLSLGGSLGGGLTFHPCSKVSIDAGLRYAMTLLRKATADDSFTPFSSADGWHSVVSAFDKMHRNALSLLIQCNYNF